MEMIRVELIESMRSLGLVNGLWWCDHEVKLSSLATDDAPGFRHWRSAVDQHDQLSDTRVA